MELGNLRYEPDKKRKRGYRADQGHGTGTQGLDLRHRNTKHQTHHRETQSYVCRYESTDRGKGDVNRTLDMCHGQTEDTCDTGHGL